MTDADKALATLAAFDTLMLGGQRLRADLAKVLLDATVEETIEGVSTLTLSFWDGAKEILKSGLLSTKLNFTVDALPFESVQTSKSGTGLTVTCEHLAVAALRSHDTPLKVAANTTNHVDFVKRLVAEEKWIKFSSPAALKPKDKAKTELARGNPTDHTKETTWDATASIGDARGWRRFIRGKDTFVYVPETYLIAQAATFRITEGQGGVDTIDFDFDAGKPVATVSLKARASRWAVPIGAAVEIYDMGPVNGKWIVASMSRSIFSIDVDIKLTKARPILAEPKPEPAPSASELGDETGSSNGSSAMVGGSKKGVSSKGMIWPLRGRLSSGFGPRKSPGAGGSTNHQGQDIAAPTGTPIHAARGGSVIMAGEASGYGLAVYIDHGDGMVTRYGHMSKVETRRGVKVDQGDQIGLVGMTGHATGPHCHFEVRINGVAKDPLKYLP